MDSFYSFVFELNDSLHLYKSDRLTCIFLQVMMHSKLEHRAILDVRSNIHPISTKVLKVKGPSFSEVYDIFEQNLWFLPCALPRAKTGIRHLPPLLIIS